MSRFTLMENLPDLVIASTTTVTMASSYLGKPTRISVGGFQNLYTSTTTINFATTGLNALDTGAIAANTLYYIYAVKSSGGVAGLVASTAAPAVGPTGYTAWREIGRCRTLSSAATLATITNRVGGTSSLTLGGSPTPISWIPAISGYISLSNTDFRYTRVGANMHIRFAFQGTSNGTNAYVQLPSGLNLDTANIVNPSQAALGAVYSIAGTGNFTGNVFTLFYDNVSPTLMYMAKAATAGRAWAATLGDTLEGGAGSTRHIESPLVIVPIAEWVGLYT